MAVAFPNFNGRSGGGRFNRCWIANAGRCEPLRNVATHLHSPEYATAWAADGGEPALSCGCVGLVPIGMLAPFDPLAAQLRTLIQVFGWAALIGWIRLFDVRAGWPPARTSLGKMDETAFREAEAQPRFHCASAWRSRRSINRPRVHAAADLSMASLRRRSSSRATTSGPGPGELIAILSASRSATASIGTTFGRVPVAQEVAGGGENKGLGFSGIGGGAES